MSSPCSENWARAQGPKPWRKPPNAVAMRQSRCDRVTWRKPSLARKPSAGPDPRSSKRFTRSAVPATELQAPASPALTRNPDHESSGTRPSFPLSTNHDDRDYRTRTEGTKAKRRGQAHHCGLRRRDFPDPAGARERLPDRLAVVFLDRLSGGFSDQHSAQSRGFFRLFDGDRRHTLAERVARGAFCPAAAGTSGRRLRVEPGGQYAAARSVHPHARSTAVAPGYRGRCRFARSAGRRGRSRQLGHLPAVSLSGAIWRRRSALQQGHRLLSLLTARLYPHQELDASHARLDRAFRRNDLLGARRDRIRRAAPINVADSDRSRLSIARSFLRGEGLVLWSRPLSAALWGQRCSRRRKLHRYTRRTAGPVANDRAVDHRGARRVGKPLGAHLLASCRRVHPRRHRLFRAVRCSPGAVPALFRQTKRGATGEALHRTQHRAHPAGIQSRSDRSQAVCRRTETFP